MKKSYCSSWAKECVALKRRFGSAISFITDNISDNNDGTFKVGRIQVSRGLNKEEVNDLDEMTMM